MRRPGKLRFFFFFFFPPILGSLWFIFSLNASGRRQVQKQVSVCKAGLGLGLVTTVRGSEMKH